MLSGKLVVFFLCENLTTSVTLVMRECWLSRLQVYCLSCWISNHINKEQRKQYCDWAVTLMKNATVLIHHLPHRHKLLCTVPVLRTPAGGSGGKRSSSLHRLVHAQIDVTTTFQSYVQTTYSGYNMTGLTQWSCHWIEHLGDVKCVG